MEHRWAAAGALTLYLGVLVAAGWWARRRTHGFRDYVTGGGRIPAWMLALSFLANFVSSNSFVGHSAKSYETGPIWWVVGVMMVLFCFVSWTWFAPRFAEFAREHEAVTLPDFFGARFGSPGLVQLVNWIVVAGTLFYLLAVLRGTGLVLASALSIPYPSALLLLYGVTVVYAIFGGMWADVTTDVIQSVVLAAGAVMLLAGVLLAEPLTTATPPPITPAPLGLVLAVGIGGGVKLLADPKQVMVFYALGSEQAARRYRWIGPMALLAVYACLFPLGYLARGHVEGPVAKDGLIPMLVFERQLLGPWFGLLFLVSLTAASMSSLDSAFLMIASCLEKHVVAPLTGQPASDGRTRVVLFVVATLVVAVAIALAGSTSATVIRLTTFSGALIGAALVPAIVVGLAKRPLASRTVLVSVLAGSAGSVVGGLRAALGVESPWFQDAFVGLAASSTVLLVAAWFPRADPRSAGGGIAT